MKGLISYDYIGEVPLHQPTFFLLNPDVSQLQPIVSDFILHIPHAFLQILLNSFTPKIIELGKHVHEFLDDLTFWLLVLFVLKQVCTKFYVHFYSKT